MSGRSKGRRWRELMRAVRYGLTVWQASGGNHVVLQGHRKRAVGRMFAAYPDWPYNRNGNLRGWRL